MSSTLSRRVALTGGTSSPADAAGGFDIRFLGGLHLVAAQIEIGAPAWSSAPYLLRADDVALDLHYIDLWRAHRGQPLRIQRLQARMLAGDLERLADGCSSWQLGPISAAELRPRPPIHASSSCVPTVACCATVTRCWALNCKRDFR